MEKQLIYSLEDFDKYMSSKHEKIRRAAIAAAIKIRDNARDSLVRDSTTKYKHHTGDMRNLVQGIQIGKEKNGKIKIHAYGTNRVYDSYKTRFFVGGTVYREQTKKNGKPLAKPYTKGRIKELNTLEKEVQKSGNILNQYVNNAIK